MAETAESRNAEELAGGELTDSRQKAAVKIEILRKMQN